MRARIRVKFCGITRRTDALSAVALGVDALGFVFYEASPRWVSPLVAREIIDSLPPFVSTVGLFVDASPATVNRIANSTRIDVVQFHGTESPALCSASPRPFVKAVKVAPGFDLPALAAAYIGAQALLVDSFDPQLPGGTGQRFDWSLLPVEHAMPLILAGGLTPSNVVEALAVVRPYAVDVSGGIESSKGVKDLEKMRAFIAEVRRFERDT